MPNSAWMRRAWLVLLLVAGVAQSRDQRIDLAARQLATFAGIGALRQLDLQDFGAHQVSGRQAEPARGDQHAANAFAGEDCQSLARAQSDPQVAVRIAAIACDESLRWNSAFIDPDGRLASLPAYEAEASGLADGGAPWRRVAFYWQASGLLDSMAFRAGASDCNMAAKRTSYPGLGCRGFVIDSPWSAAFISWVMARAGVPRFNRSASHFDYVRAARAAQETSPYRYAPLETPLALGDMLCYVRTGRVHGADGLAKLIDGGATSLPMHCDIVVSVDAGKVVTVGGNVQQAVTLRMLPANAQRQAWSLPLRADGDVECSPRTPAACNLNRQDWAVVLKLKPQAELAKLGPVAPPAFLPAAPAAPTCCVNCVLGSGIPRCPAPGQAVPQLQPDAPLPGSE